MKILHVTDCYLPRLGGIEMHVSDLAARQQAAGHDVMVMTRENAVAGQASGDVPVERLDCGPLALAVGPRVRRFVSEHDVDVVHAHLSVASPLAWTALRAVRGVPSIATVHSVVPDSPELLRTAMALTRFPSHTVGFTAVSEAAAAPWRRAMGERMPVRVLANGIEPAAWSTEHVEQAGGEFTVVSVGRFARRKRQRALVRMLSEVRDRLPSDVGLRAVLVGDGPQMPAVRADVERFGLRDVVELPGALTRAEIKGVLAGASAFAAPATLESFGIAALEARCAGVPVVAMSQGGAGEFIRDGDEGFLVADDAGMVDRLVSLASDRALREGIRRHNSSTVPPMAWPSVLAQHEQVYFGAIARAVRADVSPHLGSVVHSG
jgi:phosphatidylinositol alpha 1,6-mannosyltransferase